MTPYDALYQAICAAPDEDTPRLAFADLVDETGDSIRAGFIRTQIELARVPEYDPLWAKCRQVDPNAISGWAMAHTLPAKPVGFSWQSFAFHRGFPWRIGIRHVDDFVERGGDLYATAPIQAVDFHPRHRPDLVALAACPHLGRLRRLEFTLSRFDAEEVTPLGESPHATGLTELAFESHAVTPDGLEALTGSPLFRRLVAVELKANVIPPALLVDALAVAQDHGALRRLKLSMCEITQHDAAHLFALPVMQGLEHLDLSDNHRLGPEGIESLAERGAVRGLEVLKLEKTFLGVPGVRALVQTSGLSGLRWLDLSANRLGPVAARLLAESRSVRGLRVLNLSDNPIGDKGAEAIAQSRHLSGLVELVLKDCGIGNEGALALATSPHLDGLMRLDVRNWATARPLPADVRRALVERFGSRVSFDDPAT